MPFVRPDVQNLLDLMAAQPGPGFHEVDPTTARTMMAMTAQLVERPAAELAEIRDIVIPGEHGHDIPARLYRATLSDAPAPALAFYHGGGWVIGNLDIYHSLCCEVAARLGMTVVSIDYRLAPEHPFPAASDDCLAATRWLAAGPAEIGHPVTGLVVAGDSAGGHLAAVAAQQLHGALPVPIVAQWLIYPVTDMTAEGGSMAQNAEGYFLTKVLMDWFIDHYMGAADRRDPLASPLGAASLAGQPPALVFTCSLDPLRDQGRAYAAKLIAAGVRTIFREAEGQIHGSVTCRGALPSAQADLEASLADLGTLIAETQR